jgi:hypothetical protein
MGFGTKTVGDVSLTKEFGGGSVSLDMLEEGASSYWGRYDIEEFKSVMNPADISSLDPSHQDSLIRSYIQNRMDPHKEGGLYADRPRFRSKTTKNLDTAQKIGDAAGMAPVVGTPVDVVNTVVYGLRGKKEDFLYSAAAIVPGLGQGSTATKYGLKHLDEGVEGAQKLLRTDASKSTPKLLESPRDYLLRNAKDPKLKNAIDNLYRPNAKLGSGSTMDAYRYEQHTGQLLSPKGHGQKLFDRRTQLQKMLRNPNLSTGDKKIVKDLLIDIQNALSGM